MKPFDFKSIPKAPGPLAPKLGHWHLGILGPLGHLGPNAVEMLGPYPPGMATRRLLEAFWRYLPPWNGCKIAFCRPLQYPLTGARMFQGRSLFQDPDFHEPFATAFISEWFTFIVTPGTVNLHLKGLSIRNGFGITPQGPHGPTPPYWVPWPCALAK